MKTQEQLLNNIIGQLNGVKKMINNKKNCFSVIIQLKSIKSATNNLLNKYIEDNIMNCFSNKNCKQKKEEIKKLLLEINKNS